MVNQISENDLKEIFSEEKPQKPTLSEGIKRKISENKPSFLEPTNEEILENQIKLKSYITRISQEDIRTKTFETFQYTDKNQHILNAFSNWTPNDPFGIMVYGQTGTGKTHILKALASKWVSSHYKVLFISTASIFDDLRANLENLSAVSHKYKNIDLLIMDDLGADNASQFAIDQFTQILDYRIAHKKHTFSSSNYNFKEIIIKYTKRVGDRMGELMAFLEMPTQPKTFRELKMEEHYKCLKF